MLYKNKFRIALTRLINWDYKTPWWYFVTINTNNHQEYFGAVKNGKVIINDIGKIVNQYWLEIPKHYTSVELDYFVIIIINNVETGHAPSLQLKRPSLGNIVGSYKSAVTKWCNKNEILFEWQSRYFERIIRNEPELYKIRKYIKLNPLKWEIEKNNPDNIDYDML